MNDLEIEEKFKELTLKILAAEKREDTLNMKVRGLEVSLNEARDKLYALDNMARPFGYRP